MPVPTLAAQEAAEDAAEQAEIYAALDKEKPICPIEKTKSSYYVRLLVDDKPGVLGYVATAFGNAGVSLESVIQTHRNIVDHAEIVAISHRVEHAQIEAALAALKALPVVDEIRSVIRVEQERG